CSIRPRCRGDPRWPERRAFVIPMPPRVGGRGWRATEHAGSARRDPEKDLCDLFGNVRNGLVAVSAVRVSSLTLEEDENGPYRKISVAGSGRRISVVLNRRAFMAVTAAGFVAPAVIGAKAVVAKGMDWMTMSLEERNLAFNNVAHVGPEFARKKTEGWAAAWKALRAQRPKHLDLAYAQ